MSRTKKEKKGDRASERMKETMISREKEKVGQCSRCRERDKKRETKRYKHYI